MNPGPRRVLPARSRLGRAYVLAAACALLVAADAPAPYLVIVHPENEVGEVERAFLARAFLKRVTRWPDGVLIRPVDQAADAPVRRRFVEDVLGRSVAAVRNAWQQAIFSGRDVPPPELADEGAVVDFVLRNRGAVAYVSPGADLRGARTVRVR